MVVILNPGDRLTFRDDYLTEPVFNGIRSAIVESAHIYRCDCTDMLMVDCQYGYRIHMPCTKFKDAVKAGKIVIQSV